MKKKIIALILILSMINISMEVYAQAGKFTDVKDSDWYAVSVNKLVEKGIIDGFGDGKYHPQDKIKIDQFIKTVLTARGYKIQKDEQYWAKNYIEKALKIGLISKKTDNKYNLPSIRYEMAEIISNITFENIEPKKLKSYKSNIKDYDIIPDMYKEYVLKCYALGIIKGYPDGSFHGERTLTRAETAEVILRLMNKIKPKVPLVPVNEKLKQQILSNKNSDDIKQYTDFGVNIKYEKDKILFKNYDGKWISLDDTKMTDSAKLMCENMMLKWIDIVSNKIKDGKLYMGYGAGAFSLVYENSNGGTPIIFRIFDDEQITIILSKLLKDDAKNIDDFNSNSLDMLKNTIKSIYPEYSQQLYDKILAEYKSQIGKFNYSNKLKVKDVTFSISKRNELVYIDINF